MTPVTHPIDAQRLGVVLDVLAQRVAAWIATQQ